ncbi:hypothetical protein C8J56DRAFT_1063940 [Mycena floridula]|nr:hypothetical protein C8J56DRAFT_1063940 [Mycena floridula]
MHEALTPDNFAFGIFPSLDTVLSEIPPPQVEHLTIDGLEYPILQSQPLRRGHCWDDDKFSVLCRSHLFHLLAQSRPWYVLVKSSYFFFIANPHPPEAILRAEFDLNLSDIWTLGCTTYLPLTSTPLFTVQLIVLGRAIAT